MMMKMMRYLPPLSSQKVLVEPRDQGMVRKMVKINLIHLNGLTTLDLVREKEKVILKT